MLPFISVADVSALIRHRGLGTVISELSGYIKADFLRWDQFNKCERTANHATTGVIELMPIDDGEFFSFKYVNGHLPNTANGMLTVAAFGVLLQMSTGYPLLLSELSLTTALRTAATSVLAAQLQAPADSTTMALIGNGALSTFGINTTICKSAAEACKGADIVTTVTADKALATIITPEMVEPGTHINAVGSDCPGKTEIHIDVVKAARVVVEYEPPQTRMEEEIQQLPQGSPAFHFSDVISGKSMGRILMDEITLFDSVGFAIEDFSSLRYLRDAVVKPTQMLDLIPALQNPKDLFTIATTREQRGLTSEALECQQS